MTEEKIQVKRSRQAVSVRTWRTLLENAFVFSIYTRKPLVRSKGKLYLVFALKITHIANGELIIRAQEQDSQMML